MLLDADRIEEDRSRGRDPTKALRGEELKLVYLKPNFEGLLLRLHRGYETRSVTLGDAKRMLKNLWPNYVKPVSADALNQQFELDDLLRVARHDGDIRQVMEILGLQREQ